MQAGDFAGGRVKVARGILGVDTAFNSVSGHADVALCDAQPLAAGDAEHLIDDVDAGDHFGDGMLDLDARVHFDEEEFAGRLIVEEFERTRAAIADGAGHLHRGRAECLARGRVEIVRGGLLPHLLSPALDRTVTLVEVNGVDAVTEYLDLNVTRPGNEALKIKCRRHRKRRRPPHWPGASGGGDHPGFRRPGYRARRRRPRP